MSDYFAASKERDPAMPDDWHRDVARIAAAIEVRVGSSVPSQQVTIGEVRQMPEAWVYPASIIIGYDSERRLRMADDRIAELEAQVSRLRSVAKAADRVWEKADTDDEPWALRDMIDALEALQHGDLEPMEGGS